MLTFLGLHVLDDNPDYVPTFCSENKRRLFCRVFTIDKMGMVISGRPPCIGARYCSTPLPLDLQDEDLVSDSATLTKAVQSLDSKGWNTDGGIYPATVLRARHMIAHIRDQIFEIALGRNVTVRLEELLYVIPIEYWRVPRRLTTAATLELSKKNNSPLCRNSPRVSYTCRTTQHRPI